MTECPVCASPFASGLTSWHRVCRSCAFEASSLEPALDQGVAESALDEAQREAALRGLRQKNFETILDRIEPLYDRGGRLLEVGSAHGWFLEQCLARGFGAEGIEPDAALADATRAQGLAVRSGTFPESLGAEESFDAIVFNDVLEHLPDVAGSLRACHRHLAPGGLLVVNLPSASGLFYRLSKGLHRLGRAASFERMWQKGFPSPHLSYFAPDGLRELCRATGFDEIARTTLPTLSRDGLWERLRFGGGGPWLVDALQWVVLVGALPAIHVLPADISLQIFRARAR